MELKRLSNPINFRNLIWDQKNQNLDSAGFVVVKTTFNKHHLFPPYVYLHTQKCCILEQVVIKEAKTKLYKIIYDCQKIQTTPGLNESVFKLRHFSE